MGQEELREIATHLSQKRPGFYFFISTTDNRILFYSTLSKEFENRLNLKDFASWLKEKHGLRGGGPKNTLQGGGVKFDAKLEDDLKTWIEQNCLK